MRPLVCEMEKFDRAVDSCAAALSKSDYYSTARSCGDVTGRYLLRPVTAPCGWVMRCRVNDDQVVLPADQWRFCRKTDSCTMPTGRLM